jgi:hypothetical protein
VYGKRPQIIRELNKKPTELVNFFRKYCGPGGWWIVGYHGPTRRRRENRGHMWLWNFFNLFFIRFAKIYYHFKI